MSDDDLIRRGDIGPAVNKALAESRDIRDAIAALPARGVGVPTEAQFMDAVWAALKADATDLGKQQRILAAFRAALAPSAVDDSQTPNPAINAPDPIHRPTMTDMMVDPDTLDAFMEAIPLPDEPSPTDAAQARETALHVACDRIMRAETELRWWRLLSLLMALGWALAIVGWVRA